MGLLVSGCSVYRPQSVDIPLISHRGDLRVDGAVALSWWALPDVASLNATASYGLTDWLAGQVHFNTTAGNGFYAQAAPGYYASLGRIVVAEAYAGLGYGGGSRDNIDNGNSEYAKQNYSFSGHYFLPFVQGNLGVHTPGLFQVDVAVALKAGLFVPDFEYFYVDNEEHEIAGTRAAYNTNNFLLEPQLMVRFGPKFLKFNVRLGYAWLSDLNKAETAFIYDRLTVSGGVTLSL